MGTKKRAKYKSYESAGGNDVFSRVFLSMEMSEAWQDLSAKEQAIYRCMKYQTYSKRGTPRTDYPDMGFDEDCFYFNWEKAKEFRLYMGSKESFYNRIKSLETHGFIETVSNGKSTKKKSIYRFSGKWKEWKKD